MQDSNAQSADLIPEKSRRLLKYLPVVVITAAALTLSFAWQDTAFAREIRGRVLWENKGIEGVIITGNDGLGGPVSSQPPDGSFSYQTLAPDWTLVILSAAFPPLDPRDPYYDLSLDIPDASDDFTLTGPGTQTRISGTVTDMAGWGLQGVTVRVVWNSGEVARTLTTGAGGSWQTTIVSHPLYPFEGRVEFSKTGYQFSSVTPDFYGTNDVPPITTRATDEPDPPPAQVLVKGTIKFLATPVVGATVDIMDKDTISDDDRLSTTWTDGAGNFQAWIQKFGDHWGGAHDVYLRIFLRNEAVVINVATPLGWLPFAQREPVGDETETSDQLEVNFGEISIPTVGTSADAYFAYRYMKGMKVKVADLSDGLVSMPPIRINAGTPNTSNRYDKSSNTIYTVPGFTGAQYHWAYYYSLAVLDHMGDANPTSPQCSPSAYIQPETVTNLNCSWEHGFALFLGQRMLTSNPGTPFPWNIETGTPLLVTNTHNQAVNTAGNVAMTLWDLIDNPGTQEVSPDGWDDYDDDMTVPAMFDKLINNNVYTMQDFWNILGPKCAFQIASPGPVFAYNRLTNFNAPPAWGQLGDDPTNYTVFVDWCTVVTTPGLILSDDHCPITSLQLTIQDSHQTDPQVHINWAWLPPSGSEPYYRLRFTPTTNCSGNNVKVSFRIRASDGLKSSLSQWISYIWLDPTGAPHDDDPELEPTSPEPLDPSNPPIPTAFALGSAYPNPFNPATTIPYAVPAPGGVVTIDVFDVQGRKVAQLLNEARSAGQHRIDWQGTSDQGQPVASGTYFVRMSAPSFSETRKIVLLK